MQRQLLLRDGAEVDLSPRLVEILAFLVTHAGQTISKEQLLDQFWADVNVTENTLTRAIADIRKALDDDAGQPKFIQTVSRRGYRFVANATTPDPFEEWAKGRLSLEALDAARLSEATAAFERAVEATPDYAPAHAGIANACFLKFEISRCENKPDHAALQRAVSHARRATELDPSLGEAWATLGVTLAATGDVEHSRAAARRATVAEPTSWRHQFRLAMTSWGEERLTAVDRTLALLPDFAPARFVASMVFIARQAFRAAEDVVAKGAISQSRQAGTSASLFPAFGMHWLSGLLQLRTRTIGGALVSFAKELDEARETSVYFREFRVNALIGAGYTHLAINDAAGAVEAFRSALELLPTNGRALLGLEQALSRTGFAPDAALLLPRIAEAVEELTRGGRMTEAAFVTAANLTAHGQHETAIQILEQLLDRAPAGHTGWIIPVDPSLAPLREHAAFERVLARLATRAS